jgi:hypothetical protein
MISAFLTAALLSLPSATTASLPPVLRVASFLEDDPELEAKITAAGRDAAKLLELADACKKANQSEAATRVYKKVLEIDAGNEGAHKGLRHQFYDGKWFETFAELSKYQREEAARMRAKGLARYKDGWAPEADVPYLKLGWARNEAGVWQDPYVVAQAKLAAEKQGGGFTFRADDSSWVAADEMDKWNAVLWKCGDEWLDMEKANAWHSNPGRWWQLAGEHFTTWTTCDWEIGNLARWLADKIQPEMVRIFGVTPPSKPHVIVLNSLEQYNQAAGGQAAPINELEGFSSLHGAYFADAYFDAASTPPRFLGAGVSYWDRKDPKLAPWGKFWLRWAAAQSYVDAIDPSLAAIGDRIATNSTGNLADGAAAFWGEKKIPRWLRYGAASYAERYMKDPQAASDADAWALRQFAFDELKKAGGLRKLEDLFAFGLDLQDLPGSSRMYEEAGLVVAFLLDGAAGDAELAQAHEAFKTALKSRPKKDVADAAVALQAALVKRDAAIRKFAGL